jgi:hypothetical protein
MAKRSSSRLNSQQPLNHNSRQSRLQLKPIPSLQFRSRLLLSRNQTSSMMKMLIMSHLCSHQVISQPKVNNMLLSKIQSRHIQPTTIWTFSPLQRSPLKVRPPWLKKLSKLIRLPARPNSTPSRQFLRLSHTSQWRNPLMMARSFLRR